MDQGSIVESGTHEDLMARRGLYFDMVERQRLSFGTALQVLIWFTNDDVQSVQPACEYILYRTRI